jgi:hypothetical protein
MTVMSSTVREGEVNDVARAAGLTQQQTHGLRNIAASWAMEGMALTLGELRVGAELAAGRIDFAEARRRVGVGAASPLRVGGLPVPAERGRDSGPAQQARPDQPHRGVQRRRRYRDLGNPTQTPDRGIQEIPDSNSRALRWHLHGIENFEIIWREPIAASAGALPQASAGFSYVLR